MKIPKIFLFTIFAFIYLSNGYTKTRNLDEAAILAGKFITHSTGKMSNIRFDIQTLKQVNSFSLSENIDSNNSDQFFHIFNVGENNGFVIVSSDDRAKSILGYSDSGSFNPDNIPDNLKNWLSIYSSEIESLNSLPENQAPISRINQNTESIFASSISPLLKNIKWNQGAPYNLQCPIIDSTTNTRAVVGCGATAMAQVMKYYNWPVTGIGSKTYTTNTLKIPLSVNFSTMQYDWTNMSDIYNSSSTEIQKTAVATLMYHCGVAVNMDFNKASSSYTTDIAKALINYFGYDKNLQIYIRDFYTKAEWENHIKSDLNAGRPVLYNGQASDGGHIFVCDGYDTNGLYHFNWGWGGSADGYFELSALNPTELGIGGGNAGGYNGNQYMIKCIQKPSETSPTHLIYTKMPLSFYKSQANRTDTFSIISNKTYNYGINSITGQIGVGLFNENTLIQVLNSTSMSRESFTGWNWLKFYSKIPTIVSNGNYKIYLMYRPGTDTNWQIVRGKVGTPNYINANVTSNYVNLSSPTDALPKLTINSFDKIGNLYQNKKGRFIANISNSGYEFNSKIAIYLQSVDNSTVNQFISTDPENITAGETKEMSFNGLVTLAPGQYDLSIRYDANNNPKNPITWTQLGNKIRVEVLPEPTGSPALSLTSSISFPDPEKVFKSNATINATITNTGGYFENLLIAFIFPKTSGSSLGYIGRQTAILDQNESRTISFSGGISLDPNDYRIGIYHWDINNPNSNKWTRMTPNDYSLIPFNLKDDLTAFKINNFEDGIIFPNPAIDVIHLKLEKNITSIKIIDVYGRVVKKISPEESGFITINISDLLIGTYIISCQTDRDNKNYKFIKK